MGIGCRRVRCEEGCRRTRREIEFVNWQRSMEERRMKRLVGKKCSFEKLVYCPTVLFAFSFFIGLLKCLKYA